jgi:ribose 5-phosphate isomerase A
VPVEVAQFGWQATERKLVALGCATTLRTNANGAPFVTDGGNYILDCAFGAISDATALEESLSRLVGVVETGLFIGYATEIIVASEAGIEILTL